MLKIPVLILVVAVMVCACSSKSTSMKQPASSNNKTQTLALADDAFKELDSGDTTLPKVKIKEPTPAPAPKEPVMAEPIKEAPSYQEKARPNQVEEKSRPSSNTESKYPMRNGLPIWVLDPNASRYNISATGSAKPQQGGFYAQKRSAEMQARAELARMINVQINNEIASERTVVTKSTGQNEQASIEIYSRQRSSELLNSVEVIDSWLDPKTNDYYVLMGIKGNK